MTGIKPSSPVRRETSTYYRGRPLVIAAHPGYLSIRQKGKRTTYSIDYGAIFDCAAKIQAAAARAEKLAQRKAKRK